MFVLTRTRLIHVFDLHVGVGEAAGERRTLAVRSPLSAGSPDFLAVT